MLGQALSLLKQRKVQRALRMFMQAITDSAAGDGTQRVSETDLREFCSGVLAVQGHAPVRGGGVGQTWVMREAVE